MKRILIALTLIFQLSISGNAQVPKEKRGTQSGDSKAEKAHDPAPASDDDVVRITTNLVQVDPVITDGKGRPVTDLRPDEVQIFEDGKPQQITNFSYIKLDAPVVTKFVRPDKNAPPVPPVRLRPDQVRRTIALVVDDLGLSFESTYYVREAVKKFLDQQMQPNDLVAIVRTSGGVGALQQFTTDKRQLYAALDKVRWIANSRGGVAAFAPINGEATTVRAGSVFDDVRDVDANQYRTNLFTVGTLGAVNYIVRGLRDLPGRKSVVLLSDGFPMFSNQSESSGSARVFAALQTLTDMANRASVVIYTVDARGLPTLGFQAADSANGMTSPEFQQRLSARSLDFFDSQNGMNYMAQQTGGLSIRNTNDLGGGIKRAIEDLGSYYLIGYRPDESTFDEKSGKRKFHKLSLKVLRPGKFNVRMRSGFFGITDEDAQPSLVGMNRMVVALISPFGSSDIHVRLTSLYANDPKMGSIMRSILHVKASDLTFKEEVGGWHTAVFDIMAYTFGDNGIIVDRMARKHTMRVKGTAYERILRDGFTYNITVPVKKPGAYQLRTALRDPPSGRIGSASQFIEVPDIKKKRLTLSGIIMRGVSQHLYQKGESSVLTQQDNSDDAGGQQDPKASPAVRQFHSGLVMVYGFQVYNARLDKTTQKPQLLTQVRLFRNGQEVFSGRETAFDAGNQADAKRLAATGAIQLGTEMPPGEYVLQVIVTDLMATGKHRVTSQWIDFDVVK
ncbi:MAG: VWA domain-containing protein [Acidobacteriota bacterium]